MSGGPPGRGLILLYHRVTRLGSDPFGIAVNPDRFVEHVDLVSRAYEPLALDELLERSATGRLPERAICVTFDDGYADNLEVALPILLRASLPATVFVATGTLEEGEFWWDQLERLFLGAHPLPSSLRMRIGRRLISEALERDGGSEWRRDGDWSMRAEPPPTARHRAFVSTFEAMQRLNGSDRARALATLHEWAGCAPEVREAQRPLREGEVRALGASDLVTIGAHSVSHPRLSKLPRAARCAEIRESRVRLEAVVGESVTHFAYPFGDAKRSERDVERAGLRTAVTTRPGLVGAGSDPLLLPRMYVGDWPADEIRSRIESAFGEDEGVA